MVDGNCQGYSQQRVIAINPLATNPTKTTIHEMADILCGHSTSFLEVRFIPFLLN
jgi:hypothetical protein